MAYGISSAANFYNIQLPLASGTVYGTGAGQTIAIIDPYNDPNIVSDVAAFSSQFGLPQIQRLGRADVRPRPERQRNREPAR